MTNLKKVPPPTEYLERYAGKRLIMEDNGWLWEFKKSRCFVDGNPNGKNYYLCIHHKTAPVNFAIDDELTVYVDLSYADDDHYRWEKVYEHISHMIEYADIYQRFRPFFGQPEQGYHTRTPLGTDYQSIADFERRNYDLIKGLERYSAPNDTLNHFYFKKGHVINIGRFYDQPFSLCGFIDEH